MKQKVEHSVQRQREIRGGQPKLNITKYNLNIAACVAFRWAALALKINV
jgi:hypothetical protein